MDPSSAPAGASTGRLLLRRQIKPHGLAAHLQRLHRARREVLLHHDERAATIELDDVPGGGSQVYDLTHMAGRGAGVAIHRRVELIHRDLLRSDREGVRIAGDRGSGLSLEHVGDTDEPGDEARRRALVDVGRRAHLFDAAAIEHREAIAHRERFFLVVRDVDEGEPDLSLDLLQLDLHRLTELQVERAQRLVEQQNLRPHHQGTRERDPLSLTAGELSRLPVAVFREAHHLQSILDEPAPLGPGNLPHHEAVADVVGDGHMREQRVILEHRVDLALVWSEAGDVVAAQRDPAGGRCLEPRDHAEARGLPGSGRPEHREELPFADLQVHPVHRDNVAEPLHHALQPDGGG